LQAVSEAATHHFDDCLAALTELPVLHAYHCASGASTSPKISGPPSIKASHARRTSSISGPSPIAVIVAHPLADACGPFEVSFRARCGPFASPDPRTAANTLPPNLGENEAGGPRQP
jgi:hypothetical protein